jgi:hypothetical protein
MAVSFLAAVMAHSHNLRSLLRIILYPQMMETSLLQPLHGMVRRDGPGPQETDFVR